MVGQLANICRTSSLATLCNCNEQYQNFRRTLKWVMANYLSGALLCIDRPTIIEVSDGSIVEYSVRAYLVDPQPWACGKLGEVDSYAWSYVT